MNASAAGRRSLPEDAAAGFRMLVVDDDPTSRTLASAALAGHVSMVREAENGRVAIARLEEEEFDLAIVDLEMPVMDGFGVVEWARARQETRHLPIIIVTGRDDVVAIERAFALGATSFLCKPINWNVLRHQVRYVHRTAKLERDIRAAKTQAEAEADFWRRSAATLTGRIGDEARRIDEAAQSAAEPGINEALAAACGRLDAEAARIDGASGLFTGAGVLSLARVPAAELAEAAFGMVHARLGADMAERVVVDIPPDLDLVCDAALVGGALAEVVANAVAFSPDKPVEVTAVRTAGGQVRFRVGDRGAGIPEAMLESGFDSFRAAGAGAPAGTETGLGILVAKTVVERHGGHFGVASQLGVGTEVYLSFPAEPPRFG